jgi:hypothetical protein
MMERRSDNPTQAVLDRFMNDFTQGETWIGDDDLGDLCLLQNLPLRRVDRMKTETRHRSLVSDEIAVSGDTATESDCQAFGCSACHVLRVIQN